MDSTSIVTANRVDYVPGKTATITANGFDEGSAITFQVVHVSSAGADGIWGTADDVIEETGGEGHEAWQVVDGGEFDLDGLVNGGVVTSWYVNPDDSANARFLLTAVSAGQSASTTFTDSAPVHIPVEANPAVANGTIFLAESAGATGSGHGDYKVNILEENFNGLDGDTYIYLYSAWAGADDGFEEWYLVSKDLVELRPDISLNKTTTGV